MAVLPLPAPVVTYSTATIGDATSTQTATVTMNAATWVVVQTSGPPGSVTVDVDQLDAIATETEQLLQQDFALKSEDDRANIDADDAAPAFELELIEVGDLPASFKLGAWSPSAGLMRSFAKLVRMKGIGVEWAPPAP